MKINFSKEVKRKLSVISIFFAELFQFYILITIYYISIHGFTYENTALLIFNIFHIISINIYNFKINKIFNLRGKYLSSKRQKMSTEEINIENEMICKELFEEILDGDFRP